MINRFFKKNNGMFAVIRERLLKRKRDLILSFLRKFFLNVLDFRIFLDELIVDLINMGKPLKLILFLFDFSIEFDFFLFALLQCARDLLLLVQIKQPQRGAFGFKGVNLLLRRVQA